MIKIISVGVLSPVYKEIKLSMCKKLKTKYQINLKIAFTHHLNQIVIKLRL